MTDNGGAGGRMGLLEAMDEARLTGRFWGMVATVMLVTMFEFFDFFLISFVVAIVAPEWSLNFGQVAIVLLAAGVGGIFGAFAAGPVGDRVGRKPLMITAILVFSLSCGAGALSPFGAWWFLAGSRLFVGAATAALIASTVPLVVELSPTRLRSTIGSFGTVTLVPVGTLVAAIVATTLGPVVGWRGLLLIGALPGLMALVTWKTVPESPRWLIEQGRHEDARRTVAWIFRRPADSLVADAPPLEAPPGGSYRELMRYRRTFIGTILAWFGLTVTFYGATLWTPTILALLLDITPAEAASLFLFVIGGGIAGRLLFSVLPQWIGRRPAGYLTGLGTVAFMAAAGFWYSEALAGVSMFLILVIIAAVFWDGGLNNLTPLSAEAFPGQLRAHGMGLAQASNAAGKIMGPLGLALIAGTSNFVNPEATIAAVTPGYLYLGAGGVLTIIGCALLPETHGKTLEQVQRVIPKVARQSRA
jgi:MFS transporter, putative metabolite:H+ symporter